MEISGLSLMCHLGATRIMLCYVQVRKIMPAQAYTGLRGEHPGVDPLAQERQETLKTAKEG